MPSAATPRGVIVTLWTGSAGAPAVPTSAGPISWCATMSRSFSESTRLFFSSPATSRSMASSKSAIPTAFFSLRAASSAASLTMLARSAPAHVRLVHDDLAVEAAGAQQRLVEDLGAVGRRHEDDALGRVEAVHLGEELVQRLLPLVVAADEPRRPGPRLADRVELVDEDDARRLVLGLLEEVAHAGGAHADEHLDELRAREREERHVGLAGDGAREQGLAGARLADEQHALRDAAAQPPVLLGVRQEVHDLDELRLGLVHAGDVGERRLELLAVEDLVLGAAERVRLRGPAADAAHQEHPDRDQDAERDDPAEEEVAEERRLDLAAELDAVLLELGDQPLLVDARAARAREVAHLAARAGPLPQAGARAP